MDKIDIFVQKGMDCMESEDFECALENFQRSMELNVEKYGELHPDVAENFEKMAYAYHSLGELGEALECYEKVKEIYKKILGEKHERLAVCYNQIGYVYFSKYKCKEAISNYEKGIEILESSLPPNPYIAYLYTDMGNAYARMKNHDTAIKYHIKALEILETVPDENYNYILENYLSIAFISKLKSDKSMMREYYKKSLWAAEKIGDEEKIFEINSLISLG